jgi:trigger factor
MQVTVEQEQLEPCKVALKIHVPPEEVARAQDSVFKDYARHVTVPGFRRGKAPRKLVERMIDPGALKEEAVEKLIKNAFRQALEETGLRPYGQATVDSPEFGDDDAFRFNATVPLPPEVQLGDYREIEVRRQLVPITEQMIEGELTRMREQAARFEEVESAAQEGDRIQASVKISVEGEVVEEAQGENTWLIVGANFPEFDQNVAGTAPNEERTFTFTYPADMQDEARAGKQAEAVVAVKRVQRRLVPELDDAFAQSLGHADLAELKEEIRRQLEEAAARQADDFVERELLEQVVQRATIQFPDSMVDEEVAASMDGLIRDLERRRMKLEDYLQSANRTLADLEGELAEDARRKIRNSLVLLRIAEENKIAVTPEDVEAEIRRRASGVSADPAMMRRVIEEQEGEMDRLEQQVFFRKCLDFLKSVSKITEAA